MGDVESVTAESVSYNGDGRPAPLQGWDEIEVMMIREVYRAKLTAVVTDPTQELRKDIRVIMGKFNHACFGFLESWLQARSDDWTVQV